MFINSKTLMPLIEAAVEKAFLEQAETPPTPAKDTTDTDTAETPDTGTDTDMKALIILFQNIFLIIPSLHYDDATRLLICGYSSKSSAIALLNESKNSMHSLVKFVSSFSMVTAHSTPASLMKSIYFFAPSVTKIPVSASSIPG